LTFGILHCSFDVFYLLEEEYLYVNICKGPFLIRDEIHAGSLSLSVCLSLSLALLSQVSHKQMTQLILFSLLHQKQPARAIYDFKAQSAK
jgi:hypothetical protein